MATPQRLSWLYIQNPIYYLTACCYNRRRILSRPDVHAHFREFALRAKDYGVQVGRYVIMPDHLHLFARFAQESSSMSAWTKSLKNSISKVLNEAGFPSPHWQKGFFDHGIRSRESYNQKWMYVRENPVRAGLVKSADLWPYSGEISNLERDGLL